MSTYLRTEIELPKERKGEKHGKGRLLCPQAQLESVAEKIRGMTETEIITVIRTLREMGRI